MKADTGRIDVNDRVGRVGGVRRTPFVKPLEENQKLVRSAIGVSLSEAFEEEPNFSYIFPSPARRRRALPWFFGSFVAGLGLRLGAVDVIGLGAGAAIWLPPGAYVGATTAIQSGMLTMPIRFGFGGMWRSQRLARSLEEARSELMSRPHWYLMALGVDPGHQGRGLGSTLLRVGVSRAADSGSPCYLETFRATTAEFYERGGFEVIAERRVGDSGPKFFVMARE